MSITSTDLKMPTERKSYNLTIKYNGGMFPSDMVTTTAVRMAMNWIKDSPTVIKEEDGET